MGDDLHRRVVALLEALLPSEELPAARSAVVEQAGGGAPLEQLAVAVSEIRGRVRVADELLAVELVVDGGCDPEEAAELSGLTTGRVTDLLDDVAELIGAGDAVVSTSEAADSASLTEAGPRPSIVIDDLSAEHDTHRRDAPALSEPMAAPDGARTSGRSWMVVLAVLVVGILAVIVLVGGDDGGDAPSLPAIVGARVVTELDPATGRPGPARTEVTVDAESVRLWLAFEEAVSTGGEEIAVVWSREGAPVHRDEVTVPAGATQLNVPLPPPARAEPGGYAVAVEHAESVLTTRSFRVTP